MKKKTEARHTPGTNQPVPATETDGLSRRQWLNNVSLPVFGATLGLSFLNNQPARGANLKSAAADDHTLGTKTYNIRDFGAKGDGKTLDTTAIQNAINACNKDLGGTVLVPAGTFVIGTIELKSNVRLYIAAQGTLLGTADGKQYHAADDIPLTGDSTLNDGNVGLLYAVKADNITIDGPGTIDGQGAQFRSPVKGVLPPAGISGPHRPYHLLFYQCNNLTVRDIYLLNSAFHSVRVIQSEFIKMEGLHIRGRVVNNNDGFHFISCRYTHVSNCDVQSQDDACALFGSCQFITITNCTFSTRWSVFRFGGGVAENITISNCLIYETYGCPIKMRCGPGSRFENISFSNLVMKDVTGPVSIGLGVQSSSSATTTATNRPPGVIRNISFRGITATVVKPVPLRDATFPSNYNPGEIFSCVTLNAMDDIYMEKITFSDVHITFPGGGTAEQGAVRDVPKVAGEYYQIGVPPAYGIYARNVRGLILNNVSLSLNDDDLRPAMVFDHVDNAALNGLNIQGSAAAETVVRMTDTSAVLMTATRLEGTAKLFLQVEGTANKRIKIDGGEISTAAKALSFERGAKSSCVTWRV